MMLRGAEILAVGTWPGSETFTVTEVDLDGIVSSFDALTLAGRVPLKLTHNGKDPRMDKKAFAMGWVMKLWRDGKRLLADLNVPEKVFNAISEGYLKFVSVELIRDVQAFNRTIPYVLDAVALLGAEQPAVGILKDLQQLTLSRRSPLRASGRITLSRVSSSNEENTMTPEEIKAAIQAQLGTAVAKGVEDALAPMKIQLAAAETRAAAAEAETKKQKITFKRQQIDGLFNAAIEEKTIEPKVRESFVKLTRYDKDDAAAEGIELKDVSDFIKENIKPGAVKANAKNATQASSGADDEEGKAADVIVNQRVQKLCATLRVSGNDSVALMNATAQVLRADPELAKKYQSLHSAEAN